MNTLHYLIKPILAIFLLNIPQQGFSQISTDSLKTDSTNFVVDSIHDFHRKEGDVLNYLLVDNFYNPALAGSLKSYQAQAGYGHSLPGSRNNIHYGNLMLDMFFGNKQGRHGLGYRLSMKHIGFTTAIRQRIDYSFQCLNKKNYSIRIGGGVGFVMHQFLGDDLTFGDMIDDRWGFIYSTQENYNNPSPIFQVTTFQWNAGTQVRIYDGYFNFYFVNSVLTNMPSLGSNNNRYWGLGTNVLYNIDLKKAQLIPSVEFTYYDPQTYVVNAGLFAASNTSKGGGGGLYYNNLNILNITGMFAWNDFLRVYAQVQFPTTEIRYTYPISNFQLTVSYKINDLKKYE